MTKVAIYHRGATDVQGSIEEQSLACHELAERENWTVVATYRDTGSGLRGPNERPGLRALLENARAGKFDTVLAEDLDRFGRATAQVLNFLEELRALKIHVWTVSDGEICPGFRPIPLQHIFNLYVATHTAQEQSARIKRGIASRRSAGTPPGRAALYSRYSTATQNASSAAAFLGRRGGQARARRLSRARRSEIAKLAAHARWRKDRRGK